MKMYVSGVVLLLVVTSTVPTPAWQSPPHREKQQEAGAAWPELAQGMEEMHAAMRATKPSSDNDVDFVKLMLPHHRAAIDMAKTELMYGKDPQMHRLAQEIITDQQSETELMRLWLKQHDPGSQK